ncbi:MAG: glucose-6-phosphate dehydrogenase [Phycisphaerae bacterium]|nr:glucose-6-phosphate dehydrogenase [Phycisphaerae bacterium]
MNATSDNLHQVAIPEPFTLVVFGASGDLAHRKLIPSVFKLWCDGLLPEQVAVIGYARSEKSQQQFIDELRESAGNAFADQGVDFPQNKWKKFAARVSYHQGGYNIAADFESLRDSIKSQAAAASVAANCVFYLATPPDAFVPIVQQLYACGLSRRGETNPWSRIVIEKPFGRDLQTAQTLNAQLGECFSENQIFRIDHYLGKETVQNIMVLRFGNSIFEHLWSHDNIDHVQITVAESLDVGRRGKYYDNAGALRDIVQNHMMHLLSLIAMEPPVTLTPDAVRNEKVKVLKALRPIPPVCAKNGVVRGQYTAGTIGGVKISGYRETENVRPKSGTETFVAFKVYLDNWRWAGVPFYLRTGKCLQRRCTEISVHFKRIPDVLFNLPPYGPLPQNVLSIRVQPDEGITLEFQAKVPGAVMKIEPLKMKFDYKSSFGASPPDAYERLLLDAALGDATLFTRSDEVEAAWRFVAPVIEHCSQDCCSMISEYQPGTWGPAAADELIQADGRQWYLG